MNTDEKNRKLLNTLTSGGSKKKIKNLHDLHEFIVVRILNFTFRLLGVELRAKM